MCGILSILRSPLEADELRKKSLVLSRKLRHRGPDWNGIHIQTLSNCLSNSLAHERLAIVNPQSGHQPLFDDSGEICVTVNGEIYNYKELLEKLNLKFKDIKSDCGVIPYLYKKHGTAFISYLDGIFCFALSDATTGEFLIARDPFGVCPLYIGYNDDGSIIVASELKALINEAQHIQEFPNGCFMTNDNQFHRYYIPDWFTKSYKQMSFQPFVQDHLYTALSKAVEKRLMSDVPYAVLLSGGLDSSIVAFLAHKYFEEQKKQNSSHRSLIHQELHTFSIGMKDSPDTLAAELVSRSLGTVHHCFHFNLQEGLDALEDVIYHLETYDVTTIRAATPLYFLSRLIKSMGIKMVLSGEGADEVFGGYLYFRKAPNEEEFFNETVEKVKLLHYYDLLRANKSPMAFGLEVRVPFMDKSVVNLGLNINPKEKMHNNEKMEKYLLRKTFSDYLPEEIVWRQKEQFSDGVGYGWIDGLKDYANKQISNELFDKASELFPYNTPLTKEAFYYRQIFNKLFDHPDSSKLVHGGPSIACSTPAAIKWDASFQGNADQSGRAVIGVHQSSKQFEDSKLSYEKVQNGNK